MYLFEIFLIYIRINGVYKAHMISLLVSIIIYFVFAKIICVFIYQFIYLFIYYKCKYLL